MPDHVTAPTFDVLAIGNALVDVLSSVDEALVADHRLAKGTMTLIDAQRALDLYAARRHRIGAPAQLV